MESRQQSKVLYPVDSVPLALASLENARAVATFFDAQLHILYVSRRFQTSDDAAVVALRGLVKDLPTRAPIFVEMAVGTPKTVIADSVRAHAAELVVINGQFGSSWRQRGGSVAGYFERCFPCPVFVLPRPVRNKQPVTVRTLKRVICAIDFKAPSEAVVQAALPIVRRSKGQLTLIHVIEDFPDETFIFGMRVARVLERYQALITAERERLRRLVASGERKRSRLEAIVLSGDSQRGILKTAADANADLIIMGMVPRNVLRDVLVGSTSRAVLREAICPVLLIPPLVSARGGVPPGELRSR